MSNKVNKTEFEKMLERQVAQEEAQQKQAVPAACPPEEEDSGACASSSRSAETDTLMQQITELQAQCEQHKDQVLRARADFDNYRKRTLREMDQVRQNTAINMIRSILPVVDNLERALSHADPEDGLAAGVRLVHKQILDMLSTEGLEPIPARGQVFDPNIHDALASTCSADIDAGIIIEEYERGYKLRDMIVRPAKVIVSAGPGDVTEESPTPVTEEIPTINDLMDKP